MVAIPAGIFLMGLGFLQGTPEAQPMHEAIVAGFYLDQTEVTMVAYDRCVQAGRCQPPRDAHRFCNANYEGRANHPVNCIDLRDAMGYCAFVGKRLPTEREWEYAAGGGAEHRSYSWGEQPPSSDNACYEHPHGTCQVASFPAGAFGLYDMNGNVWEWTQSEFTPYPSRPRPDPVLDDRLYVYRGGSWSRRFPKWLLNTLRNRHEPRKFHGSLGVRCAKSIAPLRCPEHTEPRDGICVRTSGTPLCEPNFEWDGKQCVQGGVPGMTFERVSEVAAQSGEPSARGYVPKPAPSAGPAGERTSRSRTPQYDEDCQRHQPSRPVAYQFAGGSTYHDRKAAVQAAGCSPRDMGATWTSACCAQ